MMSWREDYGKQNYISRELKQIVNERDDEIELEIIEFHDHYIVIATICEEKPPYKDYLAEGISYVSKKEAARKALTDLYRQAYSRPTVRFMTWNRKDNLH
jgi:hypothetical protein